MATATTPQTLSPVRWVEVVVCSGTEIDTPYIAVARTAMRPTLDAGVEKGIPDHRVRGDYSTNLVIDVNHWRTRTPMISNADSPGNGRSDL